MRQHELNPIASIDGLALLARVDRRRYRTANLARVYLTEAGQVLPSRPTFRDRVRVRTLCYDIDMSPHPATLRFALPSAEEVYRFRARMSMTWAVYAPAVVARFEVRDALAVFWPFLSQRLRAISRRFSIEQSALAEAEINNDLKAAPFQTERGIEISFCTVDLDLDASAKTHLAGYTEARRAIERAKAEHELAMLKKNQAVAEARLQQELEILTAAHEIELKRQRMAFYRSALENGSLSVLVLQLIEHPDDVGAVVDLMKNRKDDFYNKTRDVIRDLLERRLVNAADLDPVVQRAVELLQTALDEASQADPIGRSAQTSTSAG